MKVKDKTIGGVTMAQNLTYTRCGDYLIPDIRLSYTSDKPLGKYGRMRRAYLEQNNPMLLDDCLLGKHPQSPLNATYGVGCAFILNTFT